jgi:alpha-methylacyl-CoA racemase
VELAGLGPAPFCAMLLADMGADVVRVERPEGDNLLGLEYDILARGRRSVAVDLKTPRGVETVLGLVEKADMLIEGFRPGVMERLGLGPDVCFRRNERLIYGRMTGWGQDGPLAQAAGHDINYIALTGALAAIGTPESGPVVPLNLVGDFGGGAMYLAFGLLCGLLEAQKSGRGQVVDAAMVDGAAHLMTLFYGLRHAGLWSDARGSNLLDGGAPFYGTFRCADGKWVSVGSIEPQFHALLLEKSGCDDPVLRRQMDSRDWPAQRKVLEQVFAARTRAQWCEIMEGTDICFAPVLDLSEAPGHPHNRARNSFVEAHGVVQPAPAPRFSRSRAEIGRRPPGPGEHTDEVLREWGVACPAT